MAVSPVVGGTGIALMIIFVTMTSVITDTPTKQPRVSRAVVSDPPAALQVEPESPAPPTRKEAGVDFVSLGDAGSEIILARKCSVVAEAFRNVPSNLLWKSVDEKAPFLGSATDWTPTYGTRLTYAESMRCLGFVSGVNDHSKYNKPTTWDDRIPVSVFESHHPSMIPMHGAVSPGRFAAQGLKMAEYLGVAKYAAHLKAMLSRRVTVEEIDAMSKVLSEMPTRDDGKPADVIVELGCGNGGLLFFLCPPIPAVACHGVDFAPRAIAHAQHHIPWVDWRVDIAAPHIPTGTATAVLSHGVILLLNENQACHHVAEMLRLLKAGGRGVVWMAVQKPFVSRTAPTFFAETLPNGERRLLQFCGDLGTLVSSIRVVTHDPSVPLYTPNNDYFGASLERNDVAFPDKGTTATVHNLTAHSKIADPLPPLITEPEGVSRFADNNTTPLNLFLTLSNATALHIHKKKRNGIPFWSVEPSRMSGQRIRKRTTRQ